MQSRVYDVVQAAAEKRPGLKCREGFAGIQTPVIGGDVTSVKCNGEWPYLGLTADEL